MPLLLILLFIGIVAAAAWFGWKQAEQRRQELRALAGDLGWVFAPDRDTSHDHEYAHFEIFRRSHGRCAYNTLFGELEVAGARSPAKAGDFLYKVTSSNGKTTTTHTHRFSYLVVELPFARVGDLLIRPEGMFDRLAGVFGFDDIGFESAEFSRAFHVKSPDKRFAYDVVHPRMMEFLLATLPVAIDVENARVCLSDGRSRWTPEEFRGQIGFLSRFFALWPEHVLRGLEVR